MTGRPWPACSMTSSWGMAPAVVLAVRDRDAVTDLIPNGFCLTLSSVRAPTVSQSSRGKMMMSLSSAPTPRVTCLRWSVWCWYRRW